jgi:hypothetical protein
LLEEEASYIMNLKVLFVDTEVPLYVAMVAMEMQTEQQSAVRQRVAANCG